MSVFEPVRAKAGDLVSTQRLFDRTNQVITQLGTGGAPTAAETDHVVTDFATVKAALDALGLSLNQVIAKL